MSLSGKARDADAEPKIAWAEPAAHCTTQLCSSVRRGASRVALESCKITEATTREQLPAAAVRELLSSWA